MIARDSVRFRRQLGFLHQGRLESARLFVAGRGPVLPYLLQNLALLGFGKGAGEIRIVPGALGARDIEGQFLWSAHDLGVDVVEASEAALLRLAGDLTVSGGRRAPGFDVAIELEPGAFDAIGAAPGAVPARVLRAAVTELGLYYGSGDWPEEVHALAAGRGLFTSSLASMAGALLAQEVLRVLGLFRPYPVERATLALELDIPSLPRDSNLRARYDGVALRTTERRSAEGERRFRTVLPPELDVTWQIWDRLQLGAEPAAAELGHDARSLGYLSPFERMTPDRERAHRTGGHRPRVRDRSIAVGGLGGLGSWIAPLLAVSGIEGSTIDLYDRDDIELHNLNRQVLYEDADIGRLKAEAAASRLAELDPDNRFRARAVDLNLEYLREDGDAIASSNLFLSAFDNAYARYLTGMFAHGVSLTFLDCGGGGLDGNVNLYRAGEHCILCHWGKKRNVDETLRFAHRREAQHCQMDDAGSPLLAGAISTTSAIVASAATAVALATLADGGAPPPAHQLTYLAQPNELRRCPLQERAAGDGCRLHRHGEQHEQFFERYRQECRHLDSMVSNQVGGATVGGEAVGGVADASRSQEGEA